MVADLIAAPVDTFPPPGGLRFLQRLDWSIGGNAANAAVAYARLGGTSECVGRVGVDPEGDLLVDRFEAAGVGTRWLDRDPRRPTATTVVLVNQVGERSFLHRKGGNGALEPDVLESLPLADGDWILVAGVPLLERFVGRDFARALGQARERGARICIDTVGHPGPEDWEALRPALPLVDWFVPSEIEAIGLAGAPDVESAMETFLAAGAANVAVKLAGAGCRWASRDGASGELPAAPVIVADTLGAGDAWCAGLIAGLGAGWAPVDALKAANAVGADSVAQSGPSDGIRPFEDVARRLANGAS